MDTDGLLQPTLTHHRDRIGRQRPWALNGQRYVAFFGGAQALIAPARRGLQISSRGSPRP